MIWRPMLAATLPVDYDFDTLPYPLHASPKINGYRCMIQRGVAVTRNGEPIRNDAVQQKFGSRMFEGLDGELTLGVPWGEDVFNKTQQVVMNGSSREKEALALDQVRFNVFDYYDREASWAARLERLSTYANTGVSLVGQSRVRNSEELLAFEQKCLDKGYEGIMLRRVNSGAYLQKPGKGNRSTLREFVLVKLKRWEYDKATIMGVHPLEHNLNTDKTATGRKTTRREGIVVDETQVGSLSVIGRTGLIKSAHFDLTVATNALRAKGPLWWAQQIGRSVQVKYQPRGMKGNVPQFVTATFEELT